MTSQVMAKHAARPHVCDMSPSDTVKFRQLPLEFVDVGTARIAYRRLGEGPQLLLIHGWPFSGLTYRKLLPLLAPHFTCYVLDLPGTGDTEWTEKTPFGFAAQAATLRRFVDQLGLRSYSVIAHDTGATMARLLAVDDARLCRLLLLNTEVPLHRPPWIPLYGLLFKSPALRTLSGHSLRLLMGLPAFQRSSMGYGGCFHDLRLIDADFVDCFIRPLLESPRALEGAQRYLAGIDWKEVDGLNAVHQQLKQPVRLLWGQNDRTFPVELARQMTAQFADSRGLKEIPAACLLVHEEQPQLVAQEAQAFLLA